MYVRGWLEARRAPDSDYVGNNGAWFIARTQEEEEEEAKRKKNKNKKENKEEKKRKIKEKAERNEKRGKKIGYKAVRIGEIETLKNNNNNDKMPGCYKRHGSPGFWPWVKALICTCYV